MLALLSSFWFLSSNDRYNSVKTFKKDRNSSSLITESQANIERNNWKRELPPVPGNNIDIAEINEKGDTTKLLPGIYNLLLSFSIKSTGPFLILSLSSIFFYKKNDEGIRKIRDANGLKGKREMLNWHFKFVQSGNINAFIA